MAELGLEQEQSSQEMIEDLETRMFRNFLEQYDRKSAILESAGIVCPSESEPGRVSFIDIEGNECLLPDETGIMAYWEEEVRGNTERWELLKEKYEQGFTEFQMTPLGMKLDDLIEIYKKTLLEHHQSGQLFATKQNPADVSEQLVPLDLDTQEPVYAWSNYKDADIKGALVYHPEEFSQNHRGITKKDILAGQRKTKQQKPFTFPGFELKMLLKNVNIPRQNPATMGGRTELDTRGSSIAQHIQEGEDIPSPREYLKALQQDAVYKDEEGMTPEDWLVLAITHLKETNQVIDDYEGNGSISYQLGAYFVSGGVPLGYFGRDDRRASLYGDGPDIRDDGCGVRPSVRI